MSRSHAVVGVNANRRLSIAVVAAMVLALLWGGVSAQHASAAEDCSGFSDVSATSVHCDNIEWLKDQGITQGVGGDDFDPGGTVTRGQMTAFLYRLTHPGQDDPTCTEKPFPDVPVESVFCGTIAWAKAQGITKGFTDGKFHSSAPTTRNEMSAFVYRAANPGKPDPTCTTAPYDDVPVGSTFCGTVEWMKDNGITQGVGGGKYGAGEPVTRGSMASFVHRTEQNTDVREAHANDEDQQTDDTPSTGGHSGPPAPTTGTITGTVTAADGGAALKNVLVWRISVADGTSGTPVSTNDDGEYMMAGVQPGNYYVCFKGVADVDTYVSTCATDDPADQQYWNQGNDDHPSWAKKYSLTAGATSTVNIALDQGGNISGIVKDSSDTSTTLGGVVVYAFPISASAGGTQMSWTTTDSDGEYALTGLPAQDYRLCFDGTHSGAGSGNGYQGRCHKDQEWDASDLPHSASGSTLVTVTAGGTETVNQNLTAISVAALTLLTGSISGTVTNASESGIQGVTVMARTSNTVVPGGTVKTTTTGSDGKYTLSDLPANNVGDSGGYWICFDGSTASNAATTGGYADTCYENVDQYSSTKVKVAESDAVTDVDVTLASGAAITGTVTSDGTTPIKDVPVYAFPVLTGDVATAMAVTQTNATGDYILAGLPDTMRWGSATEQPIEGYIVCFNGNGVGNTVGYQAACYNSSGTMDAWDGSEHGLTATTDNTVSVTTGGAATPNIDATLAEGRAGIHGTVTSSAGSAPIADTEVTLYSGTRDDPKWERSVTTRADGSYLFGDLADGTYYVCINASMIQQNGQVDWGAFCEDSLGVEIDVQVTSDATAITINSESTEATADIARPEADGSISGVVSDGTNALPGVSVYAYTLLNTGVATPYSGATTGVDGSYTIPNLATGTYFVCFDAGSALGANTAGYAASCLPPGTVVEDLHTFTGNPPADGFTEYEVTDANPHVVNVNIALDATSSP